MVRRSYNDIDAEVLLRLANRQDITPQQRGFFIKDAYLNIAIMFRHAEIQKISQADVIAAGTDYMAPTTTDLWFPSAIRNVTDGYLLRQESQERVERAQLKPTSRPYTYYWYGKTFYFESFADTAKMLRIWYKRKPADFSGDDSSELDEMFDPFIIMEAARIGFETVRDFDEAEKQLQIFRMEAASKKLPLDQAKLNDYRQGFRVRFK